MKILWQKIWYTRWHSSQILMAMALGVVAGIVTVMAAGRGIFSSPLCLILALMIGAYAFIKPVHTLIILAMAAGFLLGAWRGSNYLIGAGAGQEVTTKSWLMTIRDDYAESIRGHIEGEESALGISYLLGMKEGLTKEMGEALKTVGLTHIVVASGTHLSILVEIMRKIFGKLSRAAGAIVALIFIVIFASMIGWTPSITRAAIVSILTLVFGYFGRKFQPLRLIILAMMITLMIDPANLLALGWQLSFAAYGGIMLISPILKQAFYGEENKPGPLAEVVLASICATLMCLPLQLYYFGSFSLLSLPANLLILPTIPYAMGLTFLAGVGGLMSLLGQIAGWVTGWLLRYHLLVVRFLAQQEVFLVEFEAGQVWTLMLYFPLLLGLLLAWRVQKVRKRCD